MTISEYSADLYVYLLISILKYLQFFRHSRTTRKLHLSRSSVAGVELRDYFDQKASCKFPWVCRVSIGTVFIYWILSNAYYTFLITTS